MKTTTFIALLCVLALTPAVSTYAEITIGMKSLEVKSRDNSPFLVFETIDGALLRSRNILIDGRRFSPTRLDPRQIMSSNQIELLDRGIILYPEEIRHIFKCPRASVRPTRGMGQGPRRPIPRRYSDQNRRGIDRVAREPHTDGWPCSNNGK